MAPPPPTNMPLTERLQRLALTLQFGWFIGHATLLFSVARYGLSYITFNYYSRWAQFSYRLAFVSAVATYGIVVYKAYRVRMKPGAKAQQVAIQLVQDENFQYLMISLVWLYSRQTPLALLPFTVYSVFHVATYTRTNLIPTISPPKTTPTGATPTSPTTPKSQSAAANSIGKFVKEYYDSAMLAVAALEILLWIRLLLTALTFSKGSWVLLGIYTAFLRARFSQSQFVQNAFHRGSAHIDQQVQSPNVPPVVRSGWETAKGVGKTAVDATNLGKFLNPQGQGPAPKKAQ